MRVLLVCVSVCVCAKFSLSPVQWDKTKLYYLLREVRVLFVVCVYHSMIDTLFECVLTAHSFFVTC